MEQKQDRHIRYRVEAILGIQGVHPNENPRVRKVGQFFSHVVNLSLVLVVVELLSFWITPDHEQSLQWVDDWIWMVFTLEFLAGISLVDSRWRYFRNNWLNFSIVILAAPIFKWQGDWVVIIRALRLVLFIRVVFNLFDVLAKILIKNSFGKFLLVSVVFLVVSAVIFSYIEGTEFGDALWYALVTITTVGYGDIVPKTEYGREFGALMILFGVILFSIITANISAFLVGEDQERTEHEILDYVKQVYIKLIAQEQKNEAHIARILSHVTLKVDSLEHSLKALNAQKIEQEFGGLDKDIQEFHQLSREKLAAELSRLEEKIDRIEQIQQSEVMLKLQKIEQQLAQLKDVK